MKDDPYFIEKITRVLEARKAASRILDVNELADLNELKKAYRKAASKYHPDHNVSAPEAGKKFVLVKCAYDLLAFDKPCDELLKEINSWPGVSEDNKYKLDNAWGHFLWWRDKFFESNERNEKRKSGTADSCI